MNSESISLSIIIPARNEDQLLPLCLNSIQRAHRLIPSLRLEIIVALNRCSDQTEFIATQRGCKVVREDAKCLAAIRNRAIAEAKGAGIVLVDADWTVSEGLLSEIWSHLDKKCLGGGCLVRLDRYSVPLVLTGSIVQAVLMKHGIALGAQFFRKEVWEVIGGFDESLLAGEDIDFAIKLKKHCHRTGYKYKRIWNEHIVFSTRKFNRLGDWHYIKNLRMTLSLLRSKDRELCDRYWYEWPR